MGMRRRGVRVWRRRPVSRSSCCCGGGGCGARRGCAEEGVLKDSHVRGDRGIGPGGAGRGHVLRLGLRRRRAVEDGVVVVRVGGHGVVVVGVDGRGPRDGGGDWRRADPLEAHGGRLGLRLRRRRAVRLVVLRRRRRGRGRGAGGELLDDVAELVLADVVDLRLGLRRARGGLLLRGLRRRRRGLADVAAELVDPEVRVLAGRRGPAAAAAAVAGGAIHGSGRSILGGGAPGGGGHGRRGRADWAWRKGEGGPGGGRQGEPVVDGTRTEEGRGGSGDGTASKWSGVEEQPSRARGPDVRWEEEETRRA